MRNSIVLLLISMILSCSLHNTYDQVDSEYCTRHNKIFFTFDGHKAVKCVTDKDYLIEPVIVFIGTSEYLKGRLTDEVMTGWWEHYKDGKLIQILIYDKYGSLKDKFEGDKIAVEIDHSQLNSEIPRQYLQYCSKPLLCGSLVSIDCGSASDGPLTFYDNTSGKVVSECGGACMSVSSFCGPCPPQEWSCKNY